MIFAIPAAAPAIPPKPKSAANRATTKKIITHLNMLIDFELIYIMLNANQLSLFSIDEAALLNCQV